MPACVQEFEVAASPKAIQIAEVFGDILAWHTLWPEAILSFAASLQFYSITSLSPALCQAFYF